MQRLQNFSKACHQRQHGDVMCETPKNMKKYIYTFIRLCDLQYYTLVGIGVRYVLLTYFFMQPSPSFHIHVGFNVV